MDCMSNRSAIPDYTRVVLTEDLPEHALRAGDVGVVCHTHAGGAGYEVEFFSLTGATVAVATVSAGQVRPAAPEGVPSARRLAG